jgi:protease PrsW
MIMPLALFVLALTPALFWFWFFARRDRRPEPMGLVIRTFAWGMAMVIPAALLETSINALFGDWIMLFALGFIEEFCKLVAALSIVKHREFDEPIDGLIYATAASLGFATLENALYLTQHGPELILLRGPISTLGHILFAAAWGFGLSLERFSGRRFATLRGLMLASVLHGGFNFLLIGSGLGNGFEWLLIPFAGLMIVMWRVTGLYYSSANQTTPLEPGVDLSHIKTQPE